MLVDEDELDANPIPPTLKMKPVPIVDDDQLAALLKACAGKEFSDRRDEALIRLMIDCLDQGMAIVKGKGAKDGRCTSAPAPPGRWTGTSEREPRTAGLTWMRCS